MIPGPAGWSPSGSLSPLSRVDVWSQGQYVDTTEDIVGGSVTEKHGAGIRSTLALEVEPSQEWRDWLRLPGLVLQPWSGITWQGEDFWWPHGVFPVDPVEDWSAPAKNVSVAADDMWSRVVGDDFPWPVSSDQYPGLVISAIAWLLGEVEVGWPDPNAARVWVSPAPDRPAVLTATSAATVPAGQVWDKSRSDLLIELCQSIGADAYFDRWGVLVIENHLYRASDQIIVDGEAGTIISLDADVDWSKVSNRVSVVPQGQQEFSPVMVQVEDPQHPAHRSRVGVKATRLNSSSFQASSDAAQAASAYLAKVCEPTLGWSVSCVPDPSRESGDLVTATVDGRTVQAVVSQVVHPLGQGDQKLTLGAVVA